MATLSFHAGTEGKMSKKNMRGLLNHNLRKTMDKYKNHSNEMIDPARTEQNIDWVRDGQELAELVEERLANEYTGKKKLRSDAVILRDVIVQPSPDVFEGLSEDAKRKKAVQFTNDSLAWFADEFGQENVMAASLHLDETNPHTHVMVMPMTGDGRLAQKEFFKGPGDFKRQHREYREHMNARGWDFDLENKYGAVDSHKTPVYKKNAKAIEAQRLEHKAMVDELKSDPDLRKRAEDAVYDDIYATVLAGEQRAIQEREKALNELESRLGEYRKKLVNVQEKLKESAQKVEEQKQRVIAKGKNYKRHEAIATAVTLAVLKGDPKREDLYKHIAKKGVLAESPAFIQETIGASLDEVDGRFQKRYVHGKLFVDREVKKRDSGPSL